MHKVVELLTRTLCDMRPTMPADAAYLYCQTHHNQASLFEVARELLADSVASKILILKTSAKSGYPGYSEWEKQLQAMGLPKDRIQGVEVEESPIIHTLIESQALVRYAKRNGCRALVIIAPPFQQLRAFMTAVTVAIRDYPPLLLYSCPGKTQPWCQSVEHSQGTLKASRSELIQAELERIDTYQKKGDLASYEKVLEYLNVRA